MLDEDLFFLRLIREYDLYVWQRIEDDKLVNKGTGQEYQHNPSIKGNQLNDMIIEEKFILEYPNNVETAQDEWKICPVGDGIFKIRCASSFLRAKSQYDPRDIILGNNTIYNDLKVWLFTGAPDHHVGMGELLLRKELKDKYFSDLPKNLKTHIGPLSKYFKDRKVELP